MSNIFIPQFLEPNQKPDFGTPPVYIEDGLVAGYAFNENGGSTVQDYSGNDNEGAITGATWGVGQFGPTLSFSGTGQYVSVGDIGSLASANQFTLVAWVRTPLASSPTDVIWDKTGAGTEDVFRMIWDAGENIWLYVYDTSDVAAIAKYTDAIPTGHPDRWYHIVGVYDGSTVRVYVDTVEGGVSPAVAGPLKDSTSGIRIGAIYTGGNAWNGQIDVPKIYNRAWTPAEIQADFLYPFAAFKPDPIIVTSGGGGGTELIAGASTVTHTGAGALTTIAPITVASTITHTGAGTITTEGLVEGESTVSHTGAGTLTTIVPIAGASTVTHTGAGTLTAPISIAGASTITHTGLGAITTPGAITGASTVTHTGAGVLTTIAPITGASTITHTGIGVLRDPSDISIASVFLMLKKHR